MRALVSGTEIDCGSCFCMVSPSEIKTKDTHKCTHGCAPYKNHRLSEREATIKSVPSLSSWADRDSCLLLIGSLQATESLVLSTLCPPIFFSRISSRRENQIQSCTTGVRTFVFSRRLRTLAFRRRQLSTRDGERSRNLN